MYCKEFFVSQMVSLIVLLKNKGYPQKVLLERTRGLVNKEKFLFGISAFGFFQTILNSLVSGALLVSPLGLCSSLRSFSIYVVFLLCLSVFVLSLCCSLLLASSMAESSCCFWICCRNSVCRLVFSWALTQTRELMKSVWKL
jgi:hypothetical protein